MKREDFFGEYCLQLRRECETIRSEMNRFLYFALVILGAIGFVITKGQEGREFVQQPVSVAVAVVALIAITSLFWLRRLHVQQLADRWYIIKHLAAREFTGDQIELMHESIACRRIEHTQGRAYVGQEWVLNATFCAPIYVLLLASGAAQAGSWFGLSPRLVTVLLVALHFCGSYVLLYRQAKLRDPVRRERADEKETHVPL